jgi:hypothetical protein
MVDGLILSTPADEAGLMDATDKLRYALPDGGEPGSMWRKDDTIDLDTAANVYAAAKRERLTDKHARWLCGYVGAEGLKQDEWKVIATKAADITDPWGWLAVHTGGDVVADLKLQLQGYERATAEAKPATFDLSLPPEPPDWVVPRIAARKRRTLLTSAHSGSKTSVIAAIVKAAVTGGTFLGEPVKAERILIVSGEETADQLASEKLAPVGITNDHLPKIRIFERGSFPKPGTEAGDAWFIAAVEDFKPDLVVLDTSGTVLKVNQLDGEAVTAVFESALNPVCDRAGAALLFTHHHRKGSVNQGGNLREAAIGSVQWENQADFVVNIKCIKDYAETPVAGHDNVTTTSTFVMRWSKGRGGIVDRPVAYEIHGEKDKPEPHGSTLWFDVRLPEVELSDAQQLGAICDERTTRKELYEGVPWGGDGTGTRFKNALAEAEEKQLLFKVAKGIYSTSVPDAPAAE